MARPRTPTALKLVRGTDAKHPTLPDDFQPTGEPEKPKWLRGAAGKRWDELAPQLINAGVLKAIDADLFASYCALCGECARLKGNMIASRLAQMRAIANEFGIGAASRSKIHTRHTPQGAPTTKAKADRYFGGSTKD